MEFLVSTFRFSGVCQIVSFIFLKSRQEGDILSPFLTPEKVHSKWKIIALCLKVSPLIGISNTVLSIPGYQASLLWASWDCIIKKETKKSTNKHACFKQNFENLVHFV